MSIVGIIKKNYVLIFIMICGLFLRLYHYDQLFMYGHDQDLAGWVVKDIVIDKHIRLIGQETSTQGIFIGGFFYYLQIPFYLMFGMDPVGVTFMGAILGILYILGIYRIFLTIFSKRAAVVGSIVYAFSFYFVFNDREIVPTQPVIFWSFAYFWALTEILKGNIKKGLIISAILFSFIWHLNFALILPVPLILAAIVLAKKKVKLRDIVIPIVFFLILSVPLLLFEYRHSFIQTHALIASLTSNQHDVISGWEKVVRTYHLISKNIYSVFLPPLNFIKYEDITLILTGIYFYLFFKLKNQRKIFILMFLWFLIYFLFFSFYSKRVSEYYLNGIQFIPVVLFSLFIIKLFERKNLRIYGVVILFLFLVININRFFSIPVNRSGYLERKAIVNEIKSDAKKHGFPCTAVSYITDPGYNLGYRYFFWMDNMHVNHPSSNSPVYTIVFPLNEVLFPVGKTFGALGLIYPDYSRYTKDGVEISCSGENSNLTDPMFGFTN